MPYVAESAEIKACECGGKIKWGRTVRKGRLVGHCQNCKGWIFPANNTLHVDQKSGGIFRRFKNMIRFFGK